MALQDDIFDVSAALEGQPEAEAFKRIMIVFDRIEIQCMDQEKVLGALAGGLRALKWIDKEMNDGKI